MGDSDAGWLDIFGFIVVIGIITIAGWAAYPYLTGHQYVGTVTKITTREIAGYRVNVMQLKEYPSTLIVVSSGFQEGAYVMVKGYSASIAGVTVVIGTDNIKNLDVSAHVTAYTTTPFYLGLILIAGGIIGYIVSIVVLGLVFAGTGLYVVLRWIWDVRKSPAKLLATLLSVGGIAVLIIGVLFRVPMQTIGLFMLFAALPIATYANRGELKAPKSYYIQLAAIFASWLSSGPLLFFAFFYFTSIVASKYPNYIIYLYFLYYFLFPAWVASLFYALEKFQSRYGRCSLCHSKLSKADLFTCELCWKPFCSKHKMPSNHHCKSLNQQKDKSREEAESEKKAARSCEDSWWYGER